MTFILKCLCKVSNSPWDGKDSFFFLIQKLHLIILFSHLLLLPGTTSCAMTVQPVQSVAVIQARLLLHYCIYSSSLFSPKWPKMLRSGVTVNPRHYNSLSFRLTGYWTGCLLYSFSVFFFHTTTWPAPRVRVFHVSQSRNRADCATEQILASCIIHSFNLSFSLGGKKVLFFSVIPQIL